MRQQQIIAMLMARQEQALDLFQARYTSLMRYIVRPILSDPREQEECISDITVKVWQRIGNYDPEKGSFTTWLTVLSRNTALNRVRTRQPEVIALEDAPIPSVPGPEELLLQQEQSQRLHTAIRSLRKTDRQILYRKYYYLQSTAQIARELGTTERAVEGRLYRLKQKLRKTLGGDLL